MMIEQEQVVTTGVTRDKHVRSSDSDVKNTVTNPCEKLKFTTKNARRFTVSNKCTHFYLVGNEILLCQGIYDFSSQNVG